MAALISEATRWRWAGERREAKGPEAGSGKAKSASVRSTSSSTPWTKEADLRLEVALSEGEPIRLTRIGQVSVDDRSRG